MSSHTSRYLLITGGAQLRSLLQDELDARRNTAVTVVVAPDGPLSTGSIRDAAVTGADTFIWIASATALSSERSADLGVILAAVRDGAVGTSLLPIEFPAVADFQVTRNLILGARSTGCRVRVGIAQTLDPLAIGSAIDDSPFASTASERDAAWQAAGAFCHDGNAAGLLLLASTLGVRAGAIVDLKGQPDLLVSVVVAGLRELVAADRKGSS